MVFGAIGAASSAAKFLFPAVGKIAAASGAAKFAVGTVGKVASASGAIIPAVAKVASTGVKVVSTGAKVAAAGAAIVPVISKAATAGIAAKAALASGTAKLLAPIAIKTAPLAIGATAITSTIATAITAATAVIGIGKISILPVLIASLVYYNYNLFDPENRPFNVPKVDREYDFIIVGGGSAGSVLASRLSEISHWKILLLEAGGHETEISDVPILSLYLHKSKLDWKYR